MPPQITFFATKGGAGRTVSLMTLASGLMSLGKRVLVIDVTADVALRGQFPTTLQTWEAAVRQSGIAGGTLSVALYDDVTDFSQLLECAQCDGFDFILVDTSKTPTEVSLNAARRSDLVVAPFTGRNEARFVSDGLVEHLGGGTNIVGLITGFRNPADVQSAIEIFAPYPVLNTQLSFIPPFDEQITFGSMERYFEGLRRIPAEDGIDIETRDHQQRRHQAGVAMSATISLAKEIIGRVSHRV